MRKQRYIFRKREMLKQKLEVLTRLKKAVQLEEAGKVEEGKIIREEALRLLDDIIQELEDKITPPKEREIDRSVFPQSGEILAEGERTSLRVLQEAEKEKHLAVLLAYSPVKGTPEQEKTEAALWEDACGEAAFVCSIYDRNSGEYLGYCAIKDLTRRDLKLAIEFLPEACHKGYGTEALRIFVDTLHKLTGEKAFRARADGISEFAIHGEEIEKFQEENKDLITDEIRAVAAELCMEAEEILGYVLEYRLEMGE